MENSALCVGVLVVFFFADNLFALRLKSLGIVPRTWHGLGGVLFSPLLHVNLAHLVANASSLFVLLILLFWDRKYQGWLAIAFIWALSGMGTWLIGRPSLHIGASSLVYGLVTYLIAAGFWWQTWRSAFTALLVLVIYGGIFYGILPQAGFISWEGHLSGAIAGWWAARHLHR